MYDDRILFRESIVKNIFDAASQVIGKFDVEVDKQVSPLRGFLG